MKSSDSRSSRAKGRKGAAESGRGKTTGGRALSEGPGIVDRARDTTQRVSRVLDHVDRIIAQVKRELPGLETRGADVLGRARRITLQSRPEIEANFKRHGLDAGEFEVLEALRCAGEPYQLRPTELYTSLMISSGGLTARLDRLEAQGFIRRWGAGDDARSRIVEMTPAGKKKIEAALKADMEIENKMVSGLTESERAELIRLMRKLTQAMKG